MLSQSIIDSAVGGLITKGKVKLAEEFPRDFEVYMCALELTTYDAELIDYFMFPVMPSSITKSESEATTVQHSLSGTTIFNKDGFTPNDLSIQGNFGRNFKFVFNNQEQIGFSAINYSIQNGVYSYDDIHSEAKSKQKELPYGIKTGFGCIKVLQSIVDKAKGYDNKKKNFRLFFHNAALGESYLVVPTKTPLELTQNESGSNMIWNYTLNLTIIASASDVTYGTEKEKSISKQTSTSALSKRISDTAKKIEKYDVSSILGDNEKFFQTK